MKQLHKKSYDKPCLALTALNNASVVSTSGGIVSNSSRFKNITDSSTAKENINIDSLK